MKGFVLALTVVLATPVLAIAQAIDPAAFDGDDDQNLSRQERAEFKKQLNSPPISFDQKRWFDAVSGLETQRNNPERIPIADLRAAAAPDLLDCDDTQRFILRRSLLDFPVLECKELRPVAPGAQFNLVRDFNTGQSEISINGALGVLIHSPSSQPTPADAYTTSNTSFDLGLLAFVDTDGKFNSASSNKAGYLRGGLVAEVGIATETFDYLRFQTSAYYQTDLDFNASGFGANIAFTPFLSDINLNTVEAWQDRSHLFFWTFSGELDLLRSNSPGATGLTADTNYAWLGAKVGAVYQIKPELFKNGIKFDAAYSYYWDAVNELNAELFETGIQFNLDKDGSTALNLRYQSGENHQDLESVDQFSATLSVKF